MPSHPEEIIERIDAGVLNPRTHGVARRLGQHLSTLSLLCAEVIDAFDKGSSVGNTDLLTRLWREIEGLPLRQQGGRRTLISLLKPDAEIDGYHAGFLLSWSEDENIPVEAVLSAFVVC
jgi:hypothetical protein